MTERIERDTKVPGLQLRHRATRSSWHLYYRLDGREHRPKIGDARIITRPQARQIALQWLAEIAQGRHPQPDRDRRTVADLAARLASEIAGQQFERLRKKARRDAGPTGFPTEKLCPCPDDQLPVRRRDD